MIFMTSEDFDVDADGGLRLKDSSAASSMVMFVDAADAGVEAYVDALTTMIRASDRRREAGLGVDGAVVMDDETNARFFAGLPAKASEPVSRLPAVVIFAGGAASVGYASDPTSDRARNFAAMNEFVDEHLYD